MNKKQLKEKMSALGKLSAEKRKLDPDYTKKQSENGKKGGKALWRKIKLI
jgi:hypothetical protein